MLLSVALVPTLVLGCVHGQVGGELEHIVYLHRRGWQVVLRSGAVGRAGPVTLLADVSFELAELAFEAAELVGVSPGTVIVDGIVAHLCRLCFTCGRRLGWRCTGPFPCSRSELCGEGQDAARMLGAGLCVQLVLSGCVFIGFSVVELIWGVVPLWGGYSWHLESGACV
ncbi:hypothetical protein ILYODFUR_023907 [Ilyodon furcidens]|uniref:Secreted protein n=1 Tax=Ilyodon furcidens TaxID=33524 RepID=A0ABV0U897_9TELE